MEKNLTERLKYLKEQKSYLNSVNDTEKSNLFAAVINELEYWESKYKWRNINDEEPANDNTVLVKDSNGRVDTNHLYSSGFYSNCAFWTEIPE